MRVSELRLKNFRNLLDFRIEPSPGLNFILGENGQGKTSVLEGLSYLSTLRSFRGAKNESIILKGQSWAEAAATVVDAREWSSELKIAFAQTGERAQRTAFISGKPVRSSMQYLASRFGEAELGFHSIVFNPSDHDLVRGEPSLRRQFLDRVIAAEDPSYLKEISKYSKILEQRNALLKQESSPNRSVLEDFTGPFIESGSRIARMRLEWFLRLEKRLDETLQKTAPGGLALRAFYVSHWIKKNEGISITSLDFSPGQFSLQNPLPSLEFFAAEFREALSSRREAEWRAGVTLVGPHRDDWVLFFGDQPLRGFGSQGEVRSALIALKLCEIELFRSRTGHRPILLLDDFSSELDRGRREFLLRHLSETDLQVFVTSTEEPPFEGKVFRIREGKWVEKEQPHGTSVSL